MGITKDEAGTLFHMQACRFQPRSSRHPCISTLVLQGRLSTLRFGVEDHERAHITHGSSNKLI